MRIVLIDDEPLARSVVAGYLGKWPEIEIACECSDGFEGVKAIMQHKPDLVFLDIQMPKINGFEMLELLDEPPPVIFTTAFDEYAIRAFEAHAVDYLLKPFSGERFNKAMERFTDQHQKVTSLQNTGSMLKELSATSAHDRIVVKTGSKITIIPVEDILFLAADDDYVNIHTAQGSYLKNKTMSFFENFLNPQQFVRVHRSYIIRITEITRLDSFEKETFTAILKNGEKIPVSKNGYAKLKPALGI